MPANFYTRIAAAARAAGDHIAVEQVGADRRLAVSYDALIESARRWAAAIAARGVERGDRVAILGENSAAWIEAYLGLLHEGAVAVPLDTAYSVEQVRTILAHCGARLLLATPRHAETAREAARALGPEAPDVASLADAPNDPRPHATAEAADVAADDAAIILYTSGTTADPKGVVLTHGNLDAERTAALSVIDCTERDAILGVLPLFHALAQLANLLLPLAVGARVVFLDEVNSSSLVGALQERGITIFACVPQFFYLIHQRVMSEVGRAGRVRRALFQTLLRLNGWLRDHARWNPGRRWFASIHRTLGTHLRILITGGSRFDPAIGRDLYAMGFTILNGYGLTETSGAATVQRPGDRYTTSVGQPFPGVEIAFAPPEASPSGTPSDGSAEILLRGPMIMREYFRRPDATAEALRDGWLHTGDLGRRDAEGRLFITGRQKEIIVLSSGKNLYPEEIEAHYRRSPFIKELCVLGITRPDAPAAERLHAVVVPDEAALRARGIVNVRELLRYEIESQSVHLPAHKRVLSYDISLDPLPRTTTGKLKRFEIERRMRERAADARPAAPAPPDDRERAWLAVPDRAAAMRALADRLGRPVRPADNLELDLGLDSIERVEVLTALEETHRVQVPVEQRATIFTVADLVDAVLRGASGGRPADGGSETAATWATLLAANPPADVLADLRRPARLRSLGLVLVLKTLNGLARLLVRVRVAGRQQIPASGPFILCPNHQSYLDGFFIAAALPVSVARRLFFVGASEYFQTPTMRRIARWLNIVPVDPDANLITALQAGAAGLRMDRVLLLFPEGERSIDDVVRPFRKGAAILSAETGAPLVPIGLDGLFAIWPRSRPLNWRALLPRRTTVRIHVGAPVAPAGHDYAEASERLKARVEALRIHP